MTIKVYNMEKGEYDWMDEDELLIHPECVPIGDIGDISIEEEI